MTTPDGWTAEAACRDADPDMFFPEAGGQPDDAQRLCAMCPVSDACLTTVLQIEADTRWVEGVWGGTTPNDRRAMRRRTGRKAAA